MSKRQKIKGYKSWYDYLHCISLVFQKQKDINHSVKGSTDKRTLGPYIGQNWYIDTDKCPIAFTAFHVLMLKVGKQAEI